MAMLHMINVRRGRKNPTKVKKFCNVFPLLSLSITQSFDPHSKPNCPHDLVKGSDNKKIGKIQQNAMFIFAVFLWL